MKRQRGIAEMQQTNPEFNALRRKVFRVHNNTARAPRGPTRDCIPTGREFAFLDTPPAATAGASAGHTPPDTPARQTPQTTQTPWRMAGSLVHAQTFPVLLSLLHEEQATAYQQYGASGANCCWWDHHPFSGEAVGCPIKFDDRLDRYWLEGFFCSWGCAIAYTRTMPAHRGVLSRHFTHRLLKDLLKHADASTLTPTNTRQSPESLYDRVEIREAMHWCTLKSHGGVYTIEEFRQYMQPSKEECAATNALRYSQGRDASSYTPVGLSLYVHDSRRLLGPGETSRELRVDAATKQTASASAAGSSNNATDTSHPPLLPGYAPARMSANGSAAWKPAPPRKPSTTYTWPVQFDPKRLQRQLKKNSENTRAEEFAAKLKKPMNASALIKSMNVSFKKKASRTAAAAAGKQQRKQKAPAV